MEHEADLRAPPQFEVRQACLSGLDRIKSDESVARRKERFSRLICQFLIERLQCLVRLDRIFVLAGNATVEKGLFEEEHLQVFQVLYLVFYLENLRKVWH